MKQLLQISGTISSIFIAVSLFTACGGVSIATPEGGGTAAQVTATTTLVKEVEQSTFTSPVSADTVKSEATLDVTKSITETSPIPNISGDVIYSSEKIRFKPVNLEIEVSTLSVLRESSKVGINSWSNKGKKFTFRISSPEVLIDPNAPEGYDDTYTASDLWVADSNGANHQNIATQTGSFALWSPDDTQLAFSKKVGVTNKEIWIINLNTNMMVKLNEPSGIDIGNTSYYGSIDWLDNQKILYATYSNTGERSLWLHDIEKNQPKQVLVDKKLDDTWSSFWLSSDKNFVIGDTPNDLWLGKLIEDNGQSKLIYMKTILPGVGLIPKWSPDSSKIAIRSQGQNILRIVHLDSEEIVEIPFDSNVAHVEWSPDSLVLMVSSEATGYPVINIHTVNADGSNLQFVSSAASNYFQWSPIGKYVVLTPTPDNPSGNILNVFEVEISQ